MESKPSEMSIKNGGNWNQFGDIIGGNKTENRYISINTVFHKKQFTNKKLVTPFTKEDSNAAQGGTYVKREDLLNRIAISFESQKEKKRMVFLTGMGGCGKSELARAYAEMHSDEYNEIFWLTCKDGVIPNLIELIAESNTLCEVKKDDLANFSSKVLIVVDNYNTYTQNSLFKLTKESGNADVLFTTRLNRIGSHDKLIPVESDDKEAFAYQVFKENYCKRPRWGDPKVIIECEMESIKTICRSVQYNTMIVSLIGTRLRENDDLSISDCALIVRKGVRNIHGEITFSKDLISQSETISRILQMLFKDLFNYSFTTAEREILSILFLSPSSWYSTDYLLSLCAGTKRVTNHKKAIESLLDFGWLQGNIEEVSLHPLIAEAMSFYKIQINETAFYEGLLINYLGMPDYYLKKDRLLVNKILNLCSDTLSQIKIATFLLINHFGYKELIAETYKEVNVACFVYINHKGNRHFLYRDLESNETYSLIKVSCQIYDSDRAVLLKIYNTGVSYELDVSVPFYGKIIKDIPNGICWEDEYLKKVHLSEDILTIGDGAFKGCTNLSGDLHLPKGLKSIGEYSFGECINLTGDLYLPDDLQSIGKGAFYFCFALTGRLRIPEGITSIGECTFDHCVKLAGELHFPDAITSIGACAFSSCRSLNGTLILPKSLKYVGVMAFEGCGGLSGPLNLPNGLIEIGDMAFSNCYGLIGNLHIPDSIINIGEWAFYSCIGFNGNLHISDKLTIIKTRVFDGCSNLTGPLFLPEGLVSIGDEAFRECKGLSGKLHFSETMKVVGKQAFYGCINLTVEPLSTNGLDSIGFEAFEGCGGNVDSIYSNNDVSIIEEKSLHKYISVTGELQLPDDLINIDDNAFSGCEKIKGKLHLPKDLVSIGDYAFSGCSGLTGDLHLPDKVACIGKYAFSNCCCLTGELHLPEKITHIGIGAFEYCDGLSGNLHFPDSLISIGNAAFFNCKKITGELRLPDGITNISFLSFAGCSGFKELHLPNSLYRIGREAFAVCSGLAGELCLPESLKRIGEGAFYGCTGLNGVLKFPESLEYIEESAFYQCNAIEKIVFNNPCTIIEGSLNKYASTIICGYRNSTAEEYAKTQGLVFEELEG